MAKYNFMFKCPKCGAEITEADLTGPPKRMIIFEFIVAMVFASYLIILAIPHVPSGTLIIIYLLLIIASSMIWLVYRNLKVFKYQKAKL